MTSLDQRAGRLLTYTKSISSTGVLDGKVRLAQPLVFTRDVVMRVVSASIPSYIANVHNISIKTTAPPLVENNGFVKVSRDLGATWRSIQLEDGNYSVSQIESAINESIADWLTAPTVSCFTLRANTVLGKCYVEIDSSKLSAGTGFQIDFAATDGSGLVSQMGTLLGFTAPTLLAGEGLHPANTIALIDYFGNFCSVEFYGAWFTSISNSSSSYEVCRINLTNSVGNVITFPSDGVIPPTIPIKPPREFSEYEIRFMGSNGKPMVFTQGECNFVFQLVTF